jgi:hypothetical protein
MPRITKNRDPERRNEGEDTMRTRHGMIRASLVAFMLLAGLLVGVPTGRAAGQQCFQETGHCIDEPFLTYWSEHGGLAINGYPLSEAYTEMLSGKPYTVQYFERVRMELHPENPAPYDILLGQFGRGLYLTDPGQPKANGADQKPGARFFIETGHNLDGKFRAYWEGTGGLTQFGYPISEEIQETLEDGKTYTVQYFERARFELHPENPAPYDVLLGQFGRRIVSALNPNAALPYLISGGRGILYRNNLDVRVRLGLPNSAESTEQGVIQPFERGIMIYRASDKTITVISRDAGASLSLGNWLGFKDTWAEGQEPGGGSAPVPGLFFPQRGFGKVWRDNPQVQQLLGYALTNNESVKPLVYQGFAGGIMIDVQQAPGGDYRTSPGIYILYTTHRFEFQYPPAANPRRGAQGRTKAPTSGPRRCSARLLSACASPHSRAGGERRHQPVIVGGSPCRAPRSSAASSWPC